jgi:alkylhydroperoxidase family enzyme
MTWLATTASASSSLEDVYGIVPNVYEHYRTLEDAIWVAPGADPVLFEVVRLRIATLIGATLECERRTPAAISAGLTEAKVADLARWPNSPLYNARERMVLAFAESYVVDAHSVTDELCERLNEQFSPVELSGLTFAIAIFDAMARFRIALDA